MQALDTCKVQVQDMDISLLKNRFPVPPSDQTLGCKLRALHRTGKLSPITVNQNFVILDGLSQWYLAQLLNIKRVPVIIDMNGPKSPRMYQTSPRKKLQQLLRMQNYTCYLCGESCLLHEATLDHIVPVCKGGSTSMSNLAAAHKFCNQLKGGFDLSPELVVCIKQERNYLHWKERGINEFREDE